MTPYYIQDLATEFRITKATLKSSKFLTDISRSLLKIVDGMFDYYYANRLKMSEDQCDAYFSAIGEIQKDISYYQGVAKSLYEEES